MAQLNGDSVALLNGLQVRRTDGNGTRQMKIAHLEITTGMLGNFLELSAEWIGQEVFHKWCRSNEIPHYYDLIPEGTELIQDENGVIRVSLDSVEYRFLPAGCPEELDPSQLADRVRPTD